MVLLLMPWKLGLGHMLMMMFKMLTSNLTLSEPQQLGKPILTLIGDYKHSSLGLGRKRISVWDGSFSGCGGSTVRRRDEQRLELRSRLVVQETRQTSTISVSDIAAVTSSTPPLEVVRLFWLPHDVNDWWWERRRSLLFYSSWT